MGSKLLKSNRDNRRRVEALRQKELASRERVAKPAPSFLDILRPETLAWLERQKS